MKHEKHSPSTILHKFPGEVIAGKEIYKSGIEEFFKVYFNISYNLFLCPFNISQESRNFSKSQQYVLGGSKWPRKIFCGLLYFLGLSWVVGEIRLVFTRDDSNNPEMYFRMVNNFVDSILKLIAIKQFWWNQREVLNMINLASGCNSITCHVSCIAKPKFLSFLFIGGSIFITVYFWLLGPSPSGPWSLTKWWGDMITAGKFNLCLEWEFLNFWGVDDVIGGLTCIAYFHRKMFGLFTDLLIIMAVLTIHRATVNFINLIQMENIKWTYVQGEYEKLKGLADCVNSFMGKNTCCRILVMILTFAFSPHEVYFRQNQGTGSGLTLLLFIMYHAGSFVILHLCGDTCQQVGLS